MLVDLSQKLDFVNKREPKEYNSIDQLNQERLRTKDVRRKFDRSAHGVRL